jgi:single-stranded-DNA-specific exonuclease
MVAFKFITALYHEMGKEIPEEDYEDLLSMAVIATISDIMDLVDENRTYVAEGLKYINKTKNIGLKQLMQVAKIVTVKSDTIAFHIGPMINAAGRLKSPYLALNLLLADDEIEAFKYAVELYELNNKRRKFQKDAIKNISEEVLKDDFIVLYLADASKGILGTIASSVAETYKKPCFVLGGHKRLTGSGRAAKGYSILSFINANRDILEGGGHEAAAGITVDEEKLQELKERCNAHYRNWLEENNRPKEDFLLCLSELDFSMCNMRLAENLMKMEPYGKGNMPIAFITYQVKVKDVKILGETKNAIKFMFKKDETEVSAIGFAPVIAAYKDWKTVDIAYNIGINEWRGNRTVQLMIVDIKESK